MSVIFDLISYVQHLREYKGKKQNLCLVSKAAFMMMGDAQSI